MRMHGVLVSVWTRRLINSVCVPWLKLIWTHLLQGGMGEKGRLKWSLEPLASLQKHAVPIGRLTVSSGDLGSSSSAASAGEDTVPSGCPGTNEGDHPLDAAWAYKAPAEPSIKNNHDPIIFRGVGFDFSINQTGIHIKTDCRCSCTQPVFTDDVETPVVRSLGLR